MNRIRIVRPVVLTLALVAVAGFLPAQQQPSPAVAVRAASQGPTRVGFVDIEIIMDNSRAIRSVLNEMDERMSEKARQIDLKEREFRRLRFELDRQERLLSQDERERRRLELMRLQDEITEGRFDLERDFAAAERSIEPILERIYMVVADIAEADELDLVVRGEVVIYGSRTADITEKVIEELDRRTSEIREAFEAGQRAVSESQQRRAPAQLPIQREADGAPSDEVQSEEPESEEAPE